MTDIRTFRAASMQQALQLVRTQLGPQAAVLHTRQLNRGMLRWLVGRQQVEVTALQRFPGAQPFGPVSARANSARDSTAEYAIPPPAAQAESGRAAVPVASTRLETSEYPSSFYLNWSESLR